MGIKESESRRIGDTILEQMGGINRLKTYAAARQWVRLVEPPGIRFRIRAVRGKDCNLVVVKYDYGWDAYTMEFWHDTELLSTHEGVYCDQLIPMFEEHTGHKLYVRLVFK